MERAVKTWRGEWWKYGGGGTPWDGIAYDPEADLVYVGTGNGSPWSRDHRSQGFGDNLYLSSIVALRADTGAVRLALPDDARRRLGLQRRAADDPGGPDDRWQAAQGPDAGAKERVLLRARPARPASSSRRRHSQRHVGDAHRPQDRPSRGNARSALRQEGRAVVALTRRRASLAADGVQSDNGARSTSPGRTPRRTSRRWTRSPSSRASGTPGHDSGRRPGPRRRPRPPHHPPPAPLPGRRGFLVAWDPGRAEGALAERVQPGGGVLSTAGNLIFVGDGGGKFQALDPATGKTLWEQQTMPGVATPVTYELDGKQYVAVMAGTANGKVFSFALDATAKSGRIKTGARVQGAQVHWCAGAGVHGAVQRCRVQVGVRRTDASRQAVTRQHQPAGKHPAHGASGFACSGMPGLTDEPRPGAPRTATDDQDRRRDHPHARRAARPGDAVDHAQSRRRGGAVGRPR